MRKGFVAINLVLLSIVLVSPVFGQQRSRQIVYCRFGSPVLLKKWLDNCEAKIQKVQDKETNDLIHKTKLSCQFSLDQLGNPANLNIVKTSGSKDADQLAISILKRAAPYDPLPSKFLGGRDILVQFNPNQRPTINLYPQPSK